MKVQAITSKNIVHITFNEHITKKGVKVFFQVWHKGNFYGSYNTSIQANKKAYQVQDKYFYNMKLHIIRDNNSAVRYWK
tara:strand:+ start:730 stop:966 length:237 start_codon:yes stop_codon:yes gene_type:complete